MSTFYGTPEYYKLIFNQENYKPPKSRTYEEALRDLESSFDGTIPTSRIQHLKDKYNDLLCNVTQE